MLLYELPIGVCYHDLRQAHLGIRHLVPQQGKYGTLTWSDLISGSGYKNNNARLLVKLGQKSRGT